MAGKNLKQIASIGVLGALSACATSQMSENECASADWSSIGFQDGVNGVLKERFDERAARCAEFGFGADREGYRLGWADGVNALCNRGSGFAYGEEGKAYRGVCPREMEPEFLTGFVSGKRVYVLRQAVEQAQGAVTSAEASIDYEIGQIEKFRKRIANPDSTEEEVKKARKQLDRARDDLVYAERSLDEAIYELGRADEALDTGVASIDGFEASEAAAEIVASLSEGYGLARRQLGVTACRDASTLYVACDLAPGARLVPMGERYGAEPDPLALELGVEPACAVGPGVVRAYDRQVQSSKAANGDSQTTSYQAFDFFPLRQNGRPERLAVSGFEVKYDAGGPIIDRCLPPSGTRY
ncbi:MAG: DUF2799 domain-containing protein [Pseudomonadota bacterium]